MLAAAIGIGSNSLRMLIADIDHENAQLHRVLRDREGLRVFASLDEHKNISPAMMKKACQSVAAFVEKAKAYPLSFSHIHLFATSAVRDAANREEFCHCLRQATGITLDVCSGQLEAALSFMGATCGGPSGIVDIGGGSTEIVIGQGKNLQFSASLQMGAVRLFRQMPIQNTQEAYQVVAHAEKLIAGCHYPLGLTQLQWIGVGGTFTTTSALVQNIPWSSRERIQGYTLSREEIRRCMEWLAPMHMHKRTRLNGLQPQRADIVVHGLVILLACMQSLGIDGITVSECGNLEGYLKYRYLGAGNP